MKASLITSAIALVCCLPVTHGAIYQYVFTGTLDSQIPSSEDSSISISAPISGTLTLDVTGTGDSDLLVPENFPTTAAEFKLLVGKSIRVSAKESKVQGSFGGSPEGGKAGASPLAAIAFKPENMTNSAVGAFPSMLVIAQPGGSASQELPLAGMDITFNPTLLGGLSVGDQTSGGLSGSFSFGEGESAQKINFSATNLVRQKPQEQTISPYIQREWRSLQAHAASVGAMEAIDDIMFQQFSLGASDSSIDIIGVIPEPSSAPALFGLVALLAISRRKR